MKFVLFAGEAGTTHNRESTADRAEQDRTEVRFKSEIELTQDVQCQRISRDAVQWQHRRQHQRGGPRISTSMYYNWRRTAVKGRVGQIDIGQDENDQHEKHQAAQRSEEH